MGSGIITSGHTQTARMDIRQIARVLTDGLGPTLVAVLAGVKDRKLPNKWAQEKGPTPRDDAQRRLQVAHRVWVAISEHDSEYVARAWFIGLNPLLGEVPPAVAIADGREREVLEAARAFVEDDRST